MEAGLKFPPGMVIPALVTIPEGTPFINGFASADAQSSYKMLE